MKHTSKCSVLMRSIKCFKLNAKVGESFSTVKAFKGNKGQVYWLRRAVVLYPRVFCSLAKHVQHLLFNDVYGQGPK